MICPACKTEIPDDVLRCPNCGESILVGSKSEWKRATDPKFILAAAVVTLILGAIIYLIYNLFFTAPGF